jgi:hypothetical protein
MVTEYQGVQIGSHNERPTDEAMKKVQLDGMV